MDGERGEDVEWSLQTEKRDRAKDKSKIFKRSWSPVAGEEQECLGAPISRKVEFLWLLSFLTRVQRPGSKPREGGVQD